MDLSVRRRKTASTVQGEKEQDSDMKKYISFSCLMKKFASKFHLNLRLALRTNFASRRTNVRLRDILPNRMLAKSQFVQSTPFFVRLFSFRSDSVGRDDSARRFQTER